MQVSELKLEKHLKTGLFVKYQSVFDRHFDSAVVSAAKREAYASTAAGAMAQTVTVDD